MAVEYFIAKVYRQHRSLCIAVPKPVCVALGLEAGHHMVFTWQQSEGKFKFSKFHPIGEKDEQYSGSTNKGDQGGSS